MVENFQSNDNNGDNCAENDDEGEVGDIPVLSVPSWESEFPTPLISQLVSAFSLLAAAGSVSKGISHISLTLSARLVHSLLA